MMEIIIINDGRIRSNIIYDDDDDYDDDYDGDL